MTATRRTPRLRRSDCGKPGIERVRHGAGFSYRDRAGQTVADPRALERLRGLAIPPAWREVWICEDPLGHLQATGIDAAGRKQYLYHPRWRERRDRLKFERMLEFAQLLPRLRRRVAGDLRGDALDRTRVLAGAVRMLDLGLFRIGGDEYAGDGGGLGLTTIGREHARVRADGTVEFDYPAKSDVRRVHTISDAACAAIVAGLKRRRGGPPELLAYRHGGRWHGLGAGEVNEYLKRGTGTEFSAKDFRTWNATVLAAVALAADTRTSGKRAVDAAVREVAEQLGNTPAVARRAYIDPRVFDRYRSGWTIRPALGPAAERHAPGPRARNRVERAVIDLLDERNGAGTAPAGEA